MIDNSAKYIFIYKMSGIEGYTSPESQHFDVTLTRIWYMSDEMGLWNIMGYCPGQHILKRRANYLKYLSWN